MSKTIGFRIKKGTIIYDWIEKLEANDIEKTAAIKEALTVYLSGSNRPAQQTKLGEPSTFKEKKLERKDLENQLDNFNL